MDAIRAGMPGRRLLASKDVDRATTMFALASLGAIVVQATLIYASFALAPVEVDEGLTLSIVRNLVAGDGYASDGTLYWEGLRSFTTDISTGPTLILPAAGLHALGMETVTAGRIIATLFYLALIAGLGLIGWRIGGRWGALAASFGPVAVDTFTNDQSPIYGPATVLGEYAAAALIAWAILAARRRPMLAGLLAGLAFVTKAIALVMVPAVVVVLAWFVWRQWAVLVHHAAVFALGAAVPVLAFEAVKAAVLGWSRYADLVDEYVRKPQQEWFVDHLVNEKTATLISSWFVPAPLGLALVAGAVVLVTYMLARQWQRTPVDVAAEGAPLSERMALIVAGLLAGLGTTAMWLWIKATYPEWMRHPAPGLVLAAGVSFALVVTMSRSLFREPDGHRRAGALALAVTTMVLGAVSLRHVDAAAGAGRYGYLEDQREVAAAIREADVSVVQGVWGPLVPLAVLADVRAVSIYYDPSPDTLLVVDEYPRGGLIVQGWQQEALLCDDVILSGDVVLCWPKPDIADLVEADPGGGFR